MIDDSIRVRTIRAILGIGSSEFAARVGVSRRSVWSWENCRKSPTAKHKAELERICEESGIKLRADGFPAPNLVRLKGGK